ncbi:hypothetical protein P4S73_14745 [Paraglaciecola sp. Hal342]|jgi:hypothetical protein|uniref:Uncharacterized protein n=1 Tax=Paraglaciecola agarilytica NO2 TaxID=1125747 RepID=A0ABQ0I9U3_9ALTE|nr:hypothetical protein [Paraglaciecola agarilytica]AEE24052.1 hypothetical protein Glaag_3118 [Glaciecola sp. 4H-3-7+YE-5]GAC06120.1 hypothetical protein GAGA_3286 [Paraglaciecola agarilytica NO2]
MRNRLSQLVYEKSIILSAKEDTRYDIRTEAEPSPYLGRAILNNPTRITVDFLGWEGVDNQHQNLALNTDAP